MAMPLDRILEKNYSAPRFSPNSEILASALQCPLPRRPSYIMNRSLSNSSEGRSAANRTYIHALLLLWRRPWSNDLYKLHLDILQMYLHSKNELSWSELTQTVW